MQPIDEIVTASNAHLTKLQAIVAATLKEEELIMENLLHPPKETISRGQKLSDKVARFGGSWMFIILFGCILFVWILYNAIASPSQQFDPFPFILMNLVLSCIAALQAPIIMMSQNRQEEKDRARAENDYLINLKAELEIRGLHQKVDLLLQEEIKTLYEIQIKQMVMLEAINQKLNLR
jgi:uncharacterized membrane protein